MERDRPDAKGFGLIINLSLSSYKKIYFKKEENAVWANITHLRLRSGIFSALKDLIFPISVRSSLMKSTPSHPKPLTFSTEASDRH